MRVTVACGLRNAYLATAQRQHPNMGIKMFSQLLDISGSAVP
jgi:hypothetical protein